jgi:hypothetical protein
MSPLNFHPFTGGGTGEPIEATVYRFRCYRVNDAAVPGSEYLGPKFAVGFAVPPYETSTGDLIPNPGLARYYGDTY